jgi:hypothetical protein
MEKPLINRSAALFLGMVRQLFGKTEQLKMNGRNYFAQFVGRISSAIRHW